MMYPPPEDSFNRLRPEQQKVDRAIRNMLENGDELRGSSLYVWEDHDWAKYAWQRRGSPYFYKLEFDTADILFKSDLNHYTGAADSTENTSKFNDAVTRYCTNAPLMEHHYRPRVEILVACAQVISVCKR